MMKDQASKSSNEPAEKSKPGHCGDQHHDHQHLFADAVHGFLSCPGDTLVIRANTGIKGDMMVAGLMKLANLDQEDLNLFITKLGLGHLAGLLVLEPRTVNGVAGSGLKMNFALEAKKFGLADFHAFFEKSDISYSAKEFAMQAFRIIFENMSLTTNISVNELYYPETKAVEDVIYLGLTAIVFDKMPLAQIWCSPLPLCDSTQAGRGDNDLSPDILALLEGLPVYGLASEGETVSVAGLALLKAMKARFGPWPPVVIERQALIFGDYVFPNVPNGTVFILGQGMDPIYTDPIGSLTKVR